MAGLLTFNQYVGGADNMQIEQVFPSTQRTKVYNFGVDITDWTFTLDHQTVIADTITFDRNTGSPNFSSSSIIGYYPSGTIDETVNVTVLDAAAGTVAITIPGDLYTGPIIPDARSRTPITIVGITWTDDSTPAVIETHRWALIQSWEPGVPPGDPTLDEDYTAVTVGA